MIKRTVVIVLDGLGIGAQADSGKYGDAGANTFGHIVEKEHPELKNLADLGLYNAAGLKEAIDDPLGCFGVMEEVSAGKDTTTGHFEIAGLIVPKPFPTYPDGFPGEIISEFERESGLGVIGNVAASGTEIIERLGAEHVKTGKLIVYTSADSVFQIAAHEAIVPPMELWHLCRLARRILNGDNAVGRVIARPFIGSPGAFVRTANRRDFSLDPMGDTMLDVIKASGREVVGIGKIEDIFNHRGLTSSNHAPDNDSCVDAIIDVLRRQSFGGLLFANLVDTDMLYGHRNDTAGFARALEAFDRRLPEIMRLLGDDGLLIVTADHGCDPTYPSTDHTRECVPVLAYSLSAEEGIDIGRRKGFCDVSATVLNALGIKKTLAGNSFWKDIAIES